MNEMFDKIAPLHPATQVAAIVCTAAVAIVFFWRLFKWLEGN